MDKSSRLLTPIAAPHAGWVRPVVVSAAVFVAVGFSTSGPVCAQEPRVLVPGRGWVPLDPSRPIPPANPSDADADDLATLRTLVATGQYRPARQLADDLAATAAQPATAWQARLLAADLAILTDDLSQARVILDGLLAEVPENQPVYGQVLERQYELAWHWLVGGRRQDLVVFGVRVPLIKVSARETALEILREIRLVRATTPGNDLPVRTLLLAGEYHFSQGAYDQAELEYLQITERHPDRPEAITAAMQQAVCQLALFRGTRHDLSGLTGSRRRLSDVLSRYPDEALRLGVPALLTQIDWSLARRDYETGEFYLRLGDIRPAILYYRYTLRDYPTSPWADRAAVRLIELGALPAP